MTSFLNPKIRRPSTELEATVRSVPVTQEIGHHKFDLRALPEEGVKWMADRGFRFTHAEVFVVPAGARVHPHSDASPFADSIKMNWQFGSSASMMTWYTTESSGTSLVTPVNTEYALYDLADCKLTQSTLLRPTPLIVHTKYAHGLVNAGNTASFILTAMFTNAKRDLSWEMLVSVLNKG